MVVGGRVERASHSWKFNRRQPWSCQEARRALEDVSTLGFIHTWSNPAVTLCSGECGCVQRSRRRIGENRGFENDCCQNSPLETPEDTPGSMLHAFPRALLRFACKSQYSTTITLWGPSESPLIHAPVWLQVITSG